MIKAGYVVLSLAQKGRHVKELPLFVLREIIRAYSALAAASDKDRAKLVTRIFVLLFGWRGYWLLRTTQTDDIIQFLISLPEQLGLEKTSKAAKSDQAWGTIYAHLSATFGWTYDYVDQQITMSRIKEMQQYLRDHPPIHIIAAAYFRIEPQLSQEEKKRNFFAKFGARFDSKE